MEQIVTSGKYRLGRIKSKYIIAQIFLDNLDRQSALMFLAKTSRVFRAIIKEFPSMIQRRLLKAKKAITTCPEYNKFCLQQWIHQLSQPPQLSNLSIRSLFRFSQSQLNVTAKSLEQLRELANYTKEKGYSRVKCLTIIVDIGFTWKDEEFRQLIKVIAPKEQNIGMKMLTYQLQHPINFIEAVPPSVEILRLSVRFEWSPSLQNKESDAPLKVNYLCITISEFYELRFLLKKIQPQVMLIIELSPGYDKMFFDKLAKDQLLDGFTAEVIFTFHDKSEITESILNRFESIKMAKKYLLGQKFIMKHVLKKYIHSHQERLAKLFNENKNFRQFMGDEFDKFQLTWFAAERQLRETMKIPIPRKSLEFESYDNLYPDFFFTNVVDWNISSKRISSHKELIDNDKDLHTKQLVINFRYDSKSSIKYQLIYFVRKCSNLQRLCLNLEDIISNEYPRYKDDSVVISEILSQQVTKLKKFEINFSECYHSRQRNKGVQQELVFQIFLQIIEEAKLSIDTLVLNINQNRFEQPDPKVQAEAYKILLRKFIPKDNKLKKLTLLANYIDDELCRMLSDESHFPHLKSLTLVCSQIVEDYDFLPYLSALTARLLQKLRILDCSQFDSQKDLFLEKILMHLSPATKLFHLEGTVLSVDDCVRILSSKQRAKGFTFKLINNRHHISEENIEQLCETFPEYCILIHVAPQFL
ncbi:hypothetical protein FGO68_gene2722 [Halteria grandinella]|uniref:Uncharacterized protein n=1 Tax=Halteria grandinella TaxID=5974 RepID=A0A8J8NU53_HALGN|nr:hypothetical protein FGO68_gene2722 [Halteria grandinella]